MAIENQHDEPFISGGLPTEDVAAPLHFGDTPDTGLHDIDRNWEIRVPEDPPYPLIVANEGHDTLRLTTDSELMFFDQEGEVGALSWRDGKVRFRGNVTASAVSLMEAMVVIMNLGEKIREAQTVKRGIIREDGPNPAVKEKPNG